MDSTETDPVASTGTVRTRVWRDGRCVAEDFPLADVSDHVADPETLVWVDLCAPSHDQLAGLAGELSLDPNAVEDALAQGERPKTTRYSGHTFVIAYATWIEHDGMSPGRPASAAVESRLQTSRVSTFVLPAGIVTVRPDDRFDMSAVLRRWDDDPDAVRAGPLGLLHGLLDVIVDGQFDTIQQMDDALEDLEDGLFDETAAARVIQQTTYRLRKELVQLRRVALPMREVVAAVMRSREQAAGAAPDGAHRLVLDGLYADLYDHATRAGEWIESLRDLVVTLFETNLSLQDARLNTVMKKLTGWAAIIAVPTAVTGWFGQNVPFPGTGTAAGFAASTAVIVICAALLYVLFRLRNWI